MIVAAFIIVWAILLYMKTYTRHDNSVTVPQITGLSINEGESLLSKSNLRYEVIDSLYQENGVPGTILDLVPHENSKVKEGRTIYLTIQAKLEPSIAIPDLEFASLRQARALLQALGFKNIMTKTVDSEFQDLVLDVQYNGTKVKAGQKFPKSANITLVVGDGHGAIGNDSLSNEMELQQVDDIIE